MISNLTDSQRPGQVRAYNHLMRYRLRTLLIVLALGPMVIAAVFSYFDTQRRRREFYESWKRLEVELREDVALERQKLLELERQRAASATPPTATTAPLPPD